MILSSYNESLAARSPLFFLTAGGRSPGVPILPDSSLNLASSSSVKSVREVGRGGSKGETVSFPSPPNNFLRGTEKRVTTPVPQLVPSSSFV